MLSSTDPPPGMDACDIFSLQPSNKRNCRLAGIAAVDERPRSYEARLRTMATPTSPNIADIEACGMWMATPATDTP